MRKGFTRFATILAALAALAIGGSAVASATLSQPTKQATPAEVQKAHAEATRDSGEEPETTGAAENDGDGTAQAAACKAAGIDPNADNVNYDDATGTCSVESGAGDNE